MPALSPADASEIGVGRVRNNRLPSKVVGREVSVVVALPGPTAYILDWLLEVWSDGRGDLDSPHPSYIAKRSSLNPFVPAASLLLVHPFGLSHYCANAGRAVQLYILCAV